MNFVDNNNLFRNTFQIQCLRRIFKVSHRNPLRDRISNNMIRWKSFPTIKETIQQQLLMVQARVPDGQVEASTSTA